MGVSEIGAVMLLSDCVRREYTSNLLAVTAM